MALKKLRYQTSTGEHGSTVIEVTGLCAPGDAQSIEAGCTRRYLLETIPNAAGVVLKPMDGTAGTIVKVTPTTTNVEYDCVKVDGRVNPFAARQPAAAAVYPGEMVLSFYMRYQQVGVVA